MCQPSGDCSVWQRPFVSGITAYAFAVLGSRHETQEILSHLKNLSPERYVDPYEIAVVYAGLGEEDAAMQWLEAAIGNTQ